MKLTKIQQDLLTLLMHYIKNKDTIIGIMLFLNTDENRLEMIHYIVDNMKKTNITEEMINEKLKEILEK